MPMVRTEDRNHYLQASSSLLKLL